MTIFFSTNIPEMRAMMTFNRVSNQIATIQERITTGQRINSGKDDPTGLVIREGMRVEMKNIQAMQSYMKQADAVLETASSGMMELLEVLQGNDDNSTGLVRLLSSGVDATNVATVKGAANDILKMYDSVIGATTYNGENLLANGMSKTFQIGSNHSGTAQTITVSTANLDSPGAALLTAINAMDGITASLTTTAITNATTLINTITTELGKLGYKQQIIAQNQSLLDSRLTSVTEAEGLISNVDLATESSRLARAELLAENAMNAIMYNRSYAQFAVTSLFG
jgi:flagellin